MPPTVVKSRVDTFPYRTSSTAGGTSITNHARWHAISDCIGGPQPHGPQIACPRSHGKLAIASAPARHPLERPTFHCEKPEEDSRIYRLKHAAGVAQELHVACLGTVGHHHRATEACPARDRLHWGDRPDKQRRLRLPRRTAPVGPDVFAFRVARSCLRYSTVPQQPMQGDMRLLCMLNSPRAIFALL